MDAQEIQEKTEQILNEKKGLARITALSNLISINPSLCADYILSRLEHRTVAETRVKIASTIISQFQTMLDNVKAIEEIE